MSAVQLTLPGWKRAGGAHRHHQPAGRPVHRRRAGAGSPGRTGVNGQIWDLDRPIDQNATFAVLTDKDPAALEVLRHSAAHILATAVREIFPKAAIGFGPPIEDGFYYDFDVGRPFTPEDLELIERKMAEVTAKDYPFTREVVSRAEANQRFKEDPLKLERISDLGDDETISVYTDGPFVDLCRGPHVPSTGRLKHFKLLSAAGAYWRG